MDHDIKMAAVDIDGTFVRSDYTYDVPRFRRILERMKKAGCSFVVASGNQYYQLRDLFGGYAGRDRTFCRRPVPGVPGGPDRHVRHGQRLLSARHSKSRIF